MTPEQKQALDAIADRCGALYQTVGRLGDAHGIDVAAILDEVLAITQGIETASGRNGRHDGSTKRATPTPAQILRDPKSSRAAKSAAASALVRK